MASMTCLHAATMPAVCLTSTSAALHVLCQHTLCIGLAEEVCCYWRRRLQDNHVPY
jgi:hypothetical protein